MTVKIKDKKSTENFSWDSDKHHLDVPFREEDVAMMKSLMPDLSGDKASSGESAFMLDDIKEGDIVDVKVIAITDKHVIVKTKMKSEGLISIQEFIEIGDDDIKVGDTCKVLVIKLEDENGIISLSRKAAVSTIHWNALCDAVKDGDALVSGWIGAKIRGGFRVDLGYGIPGFLPNSQTGMSSPEEFESLYSGKECKCRPISIGSNIVVSMKEMVTASRKDKKMEILKTLTKGSIVEGVIKNITNFGVFVNVDKALDGLIRLPDLSYKRIKRPSELNIAEGDPIRVVVLSNDGESVSFGLKQVDESPWKEVENKFPVGSVVTGKAVNIMTYGIFVEVEPGIEGLVHFSEIPISQPISSLNEIVSLGDEITSTVIYSNSKTSKLSLSMIRQGYENVDWSKIDEKYAIGTKHKAIVKSLLSHYAIVELEPGVTAQVLASDISTEQLSHTSKELSIDDEVDVRILKISQYSGSENSTPKKIVAGIRQFYMDNWEEEKSIKEGDLVSATIIKITHMGALATFGNDHKGYIHVSEISDSSNKQKVEDLLNIGDQVTALVTTVDKDQKMINLSIKQAKGGKV